MPKVCTITISLDGTDFKVERKDEGYDASDAFNIVSYLGTICMMLCSVGARRGHVSLTNIVMQLDAMSREPGEPK